jgi:hypothetical protein
MTCLVAVETSALLHVFLSFAIGHALMREVWLSLSSVNVHQDIFKVGLLGGVCGGGSCGFGAAIVLCCALFLLGKYVFAFAPGSVEGGCMVSPFGECLRLISQLHPKYLGDERAVHMAHYDSSEVLVVLDLFVP